MKRKLMGLLGLMILDLAVVAASAQTITQQTGTSLNPNSFNGMLYAQPGSSLSTLCSSFTGTVVVTSAINVTSTTTIPVGCKIRVEKGGKINISPGIRLMINGQLEAGNYTVFTGAGNNLVAFGNNAVPAIRPQWWGAMGDGVTPDQAAIQLAIDTAAVSATKVVDCAPGNYLINSPINVTSGTGVGKDLIRSSISFIGEGRRGGCVITGNTGGVMFELSGSAYTSWRGIFLRNNGQTNPSTVGFYVAATTVKTEALYNDFSQITIDLYLPTFSSTFGSVGYMLIGSEENTIHATNTYATTPFVLTTSYAMVRGSYPSPFRASSILAAHSLGVTTFSGENSVVTFDSKGPNMAFYGANSVDLGNIYFADQDIGTPGSIKTAISVLGGTLESFRGHCKIESKNIFADVSASQIYDWKFQLAFGAGGSASFPVMRFNTAGLSQQLLEGLDLSVSYDIPSSFPGKAIFDVTGTPNIVPVISNVSATVNQTLAQYNTFPWPAWFIGVTTNATLKLVDTTLRLNSMQQTKTISGAVNLGAGNSTIPVKIGTIFLPPILTGFNAQALSVRVTGLASSISPSSPGNDLFVASVPIDTTRGAWSTAAGAIAIGPGTSDSQLRSIAATSVSTTAGLDLITGINLVLTYNSGARTITVAAYPIVTGSNPGGINVFLSNAKIELLAAGRQQVLAYIGN